MYGYIRPFVNELKVGEYEKYRAAYCGLCRSIGKITGQLSRLTLSYDLTFLAMVRTALSETPSEFETFRCPAHMRKKRLVLRDNEELRYAASFSSLLLKLKNDDDILDEKGAIKLRSAAAKPFLSYMSRRGEKNLTNDFTEKIRGCLTKLFQAELERCDSIDRTSGIFGELSAFGFSTGFNGEKRDIAENIGRGIGRFIYVCDAADDLPCDVKRGRYNPLYLSWGDKALENGKISPILRESVMTAALLNLSLLEKYIERLDKSNPYTPIIKNIVYLGLPASLNRILSGEKRKTENKRDVLPKDMMQ